MVFARLSWTCLTACFAYCRCCCCRWAAKSKHACSSLVRSDQPGFLCKGCCNICAWMACNCVAAICCLIPVGALFVYIVSGLVGGAGKGPAAQYDLVAGCCAKKDCLLLRGNHCLHSATGNGQRCARQRVAVPPLCAGCSYGLLLQAAAASVLDRSGDAAPSAPTRPMSYHAV